MLRQAFVLINSEPGAEREALAALEAIPEVREALMVYGVYDIIARVEAETFEEVKHAISYKIRCIDEVRSTLTLICIETLGARVRAEERR